MGLVKERSVQKEQENKVFFSLREGSNYKILMTYDRSEVVEFEQFKKITFVLNDAQQKFITINQRIVNKSTIIDICPTDEKTELQRIESKQNSQDLLVDDGKGNPVKLSELKSKWEE